MNNTQAVASSVHAYSRRSRLTTARRVVARFESPKLVDIRESLPPWKRYVEIHVSVDLTSTDVTYFHGRDCISSVPPRRGLGLVLYLPSNLSPFDLEVTHAPNGGQVGLELGLGLRE